MGEKPSVDHVERIDWVWAYFATQPMASVARTCFFNSEHLWSTGSVIAGWCIKWVMKDRPCANGDRGRPFAESGTGMQVVP